VSTARFSLYDKRGIMVVGVGFIIMVGIACVCLTDLFCT
jgi:hypothetical protein